jgi:hypothetical protein
MPPLVRHAPWNDRWNELQSSGDKTSSGDTAHASEIGARQPRRAGPRPPEAGAQVRILPGAPTAGGAQEIRVV